MPLPSLSAGGEEEEEKKESVVVSLSTSANADDGESGGGLYADAEERAFYEQLPDLRAVLPAVLFSEEGDADTSGLEEAMRRLPSCSSRREVDDLASELTMRGLRSARRPLVRALLSPPASAADAPRCYARLAAVLSGAFKHVGSEVGSLVAAEFEQLTERPEQDLP